MPGWMRTDYFLKIELIALDERLCSSLNRIMQLCDQAKENNNPLEVDRLRRVNRVLVATKRRLDRFGKTDLA
jgi:hypothetical protein